MKRTFLLLSSLLITSAYLPALSAEEKIHQHHTMPKEMDHSGHQMTDKKEDHSQHSMTDHSDHKMDHSGHAMNSDSDDPHAQHKAMMKQQSLVVRSNHEYKIPDLRMKDKQGESVNIRELLNQDQPVMVNFIFTTCPTICPVLSSTFSVVNRELGSESQLTMISISIDPEQDTPATLRDYASKFSAKENWKFITGQIESSISLQKAFNIYRGSKMNHIPATFFRASSDQPWTRLDGFPSSDDLIAEYHKMVH